MTTTFHPPDLAPLSVLLDVKAVAQLLGCSTRHVFRLSEADKMPPPVRIGHLVRWRRSDLDDWLASGCPATSQNCQ